MAFGVLLSASSVAIAADFVTPICTNPTGCVTINPAVPTSGQKIDVSIQVSSGVPADASPCPLNLDTTIAGKIITIRGLYASCGLIGLEPPPPYFVQTTLEPLAPGDYSVVLALSADPAYGDVGWVYGANGLEQAGVLISSPLTVTAGPLAPPNYEGLWWASPAGSESGWGINFAHQGDVIFATWFTYNASGNPWWLAMVANQTGPTTFSGQLYQTRGPAFDAAFDPSQVDATPIGTGSLSFSTANDGTFTYSVNGITQAKSITREEFRSLPNCTFGIESDLSLASNYQDLWWASPAGVESGWGVNLTHQSDVIFGTWFTYDAEGSPSWLAFTAFRIEPRKYEGAVFRTHGPSFDATPFDPAAVIATIVGTATLTFSDGNAAIFAYDVDGVSRTKSITREIFRSPGTVCQ